VIRLVEQSWRRLVIDGREHPHAFMGSGAEQRTCTVTRTRQAVRVESGLEGLALLKTTDSAFRGFLRDAWTTLRETDDRIVATVVSARWLYGTVPVDWDRCHQLVREALIEVFARHRSLAVQQTLHAMGAAALERCAEIEEITLELPNKHHLLVNLEPFGMPNPNEVFVPTAEPHGIISGTLRRSR
jgi:urate oxidase